MFTLTGRYGERGSILSLEARARRGSLAAFSGRGMGRKREVCVNKILGMWGAARKIKGPFSPGGKCESHASGVSGRLPNLLRTFSLGFWVGWTTRGRSLLGRKQPRSTSKK